MKIRAFLLLLFTGFLLWSCNQPKPEVMESEMAATTPPAEFANPQFAEIGKQGLMAMANKDIEAFVENYAEDIVYLWNSGDSVAGKQAIKEYWKDRMDNVIEKFNYDNDIWLAIKINQSQRGPDVPGVWLLGWFRATITYKGGITITQWIHTDFHFDGNEKIDRVIMYLDRAPINAALAGK